MTKALLLRIGKGDVSRSGVIVSPFFELENPECGHEGEDAEALNGLGGLQSGRFEVQSSPLEDGKELLDAPAPTIPLNDR
jgi:hypothetical protein